MASKKTPAKKVAAKKAAPRTKADTTPKFPYTTKPGSLRRFLKDIPKKPKPAKFDIQLLKSWGFTDANDHSMLRVCKAMNLLNDKNEPTETYAAFMHLDHGAKVLGQEIRRVYAPLFQASHTPYAEGNEKLQSLFNIHSGGGERALDQQMQTFKALCENASFDVLPNGTGSGVSSSGAGGAAVSNRAIDMSHGFAGNGAPSININLHIHLPENKGRRDYEAIIEDIGRYIFGRASGDRRE